MKDNYVFISYASEDKRQALEIYHFLQYAGYNPWIDIKYIYPGEDFNIKITNAIQQSKLFIACLSTNSVDKVGVVQAELKYALTILDQHPEDQAYIIPIRLNECKIPIRIKQLSYVNWFEEDSHGKLLQTVNKAYTNFKSDTNKSLNLPLKKTKTKPTEIETNQYQDPNAFNAQIHKVNFVLNGYHEVIIRIEQVKMIHAVLTITVDNRQIDKRSHLLNMASGIFEFKLEGISCKLRYQLMLVAWRMTLDIGGTVVLST